MSALTSQLAWHCPAWLSRGHERQSWWRHHLSQARRQIAAFDKEIIVHLGMAQTGGKPSPSTEIAPLGGGPPRTTMRMKMKPSLFKRGKCPSCVRAWHDSDRGGRRLAVRQSCAPWNDVGRVSKILQAVRGGIGQSGRSEAQTYRSLRT
jgi:hypothetical protein